MGIFYLYLFWSWSETELQDFLKFVNSSNPNIRLSVEYSQEKVNFLDTTIFLKILRVIYIRLSLEDPQIEIVFYRAKALILSG